MLQKEKLLKVYAGCSAEPTNEEERNGRLKAELSYTNFGKIAELLLKQEKAVI
ncbi:hypothetical protein [Bacillus sp. FJAT-52991]|uniref:Uncharacterized protein n=1 Tax=Bacillus kandeliae TaxID=3129297 RepID=A0ABZ2NCG6_9BACI